MSTRPMGMAVVAGVGGGWRGSNQAPPFPYNLPNYSRPCEECLQVLPTGALPAGLSASAFLLCFSSSFHQEALKGTRRCLFPLPGWCC